MPIAALERVECKVDLVDREIGYAAGSQDDDLISLISAAAGHQADELGVARDDEPQIPADVAPDLTGSSRDCTSSSASTRWPFRQVLSELLRRSVFRSSTSCS
ncbi:hypothetical protein [Mycolicibacterium canariasense]|uniref:hypothetical protein n=1 Tax=Mycolicibacterium canariasense TaxID=228230 RepID=UPI0032D5935D